MNTRYLKLAAGVLALVFAAATGTALAAEHGTFGRSQVVSRVAIYLGVTPAATIVRNYRVGSSERSMHGGVPQGDHYHHVMIALFDTETGKRITDAKVTATVRELGFSETTEELVPMKIAGYTAYGNYFEMPHMALYRIEVQIVRPEVPAAITAEFDYEHKPY